VSKLLTFVACAFLVGSFLAFQDDPPTHDELVVVLVAAGAALAVCLALFFTYEPSDGAARRGVHRDARPVSPLRWLLGAPFIVAAHVGVVLLGLCAIIGELSACTPGGMVNLPNVSRRRIARHAWRLWAGALAVCLAIGAAGEHLDGGIPMSFVLGAALLAVTRLVTRWMDRADLRPVAAGAPGPGDATFSPVSGATPPASSTGPFL
jgi:hypothetical protein